MRGEAEEAPSTMIVVKTKSVGVSLILTFLLGPIGMFYSTIIGAFIMLVVSLLVAVFTLGIGLIVTWPLSILWGALSTSSYNRKLLEGKRQY